MKILIATSEAAPFAKTGGLADVCGALPGALAELGESPTVIMPAYREALASGEPIEPTGLQFDIPIADRIVTGGVLRSRLPGDVPLYLVQQPQYFDRAGLYGERGQDYEDNCERFVFFSRAVLELIRLLDLQTEVLHCNDWQTGLAPACLREEYHSTVGYERIGSLMTIHNLAYQGVFPSWGMQLAGMDPALFNLHQMEFYGRVNLLKTGLVFADRLSTVSPQYAAEIQQPEWGCGLEGVLQERRERLHGIVNGVDYSQWCPIADPHLPQNYDTTCWSTTKPICKAALQQELGLPANAEAPLVGIIGRLAPQKGWDLIVPLIQRWAADEDVQWAVLGTGERECEQRIAALAEQFPNRVAARLQFSNPLAHRIEAAADMFLMPSHYEPCGLNQLYSLRYGAVPVVHSTGGLVDTIRDADSDAMRAGEANGFRFAPYQLEALDLALRRACQMFWGQPQHWRQLVETGMRQDWSWQHSARQYIRLYQQLTSA